MDTSTRPRGSFGTTKKNIPGVIFRSKSMFSNMTLNIALFASPTIALSVFLALINSLVTAQDNATQTRTRGAAALRNTKRDAVWTAMETLLAYVQSLADAMTVEQAVSLIQAAGLVVAGVAAHAKAILAATLTSVPGTVHLAANRKLLVGPANAAKKVTFNWQVSTDGKNFTNLPSTPYASTDVPGLTPMTTYTFRVSVTVARVTGEWSQPVSVVVH